MHFLKGARSSRSRFLVGAGAAIVTGCSGGGGGGGGTGNGLPSTSNPATAAPSTGTGSSGGGSGLVGVGDVNTYFIDYTGSQAPGATYAQAFTVSTPTNFVFRCASDYVAQFAVMDASQQSAFVAGQAYQYLYGFSDQYGTVTLTLQPGSYAVGARNQSNSPNGVRFELDLAVAVPAADGYHFSGYVLNGVANVAPGTRATTAFTLQPRYRYFLDGANSGGLNVYVMPSSAVSAFIGGSTFESYPQFSGTTPDEPGLSEISTLGSGNYALGWSNATSIPHTIVYTLEGWAPN